MKIILLEDVRKVGKKDDILNVSDGYATNYLIKNKLAVPYTKKSKEILDLAIEEKEKAEEAKINEYLKIKEKLENKTFDFKVKTGAQDKVFGKVSSKQIADKLKEAGFNIDKKCLKIDYDIDSLGLSEVSVVLHKKVEFKIKINLRR